MVAIDASLAVDLGGKLDRIGASTDMMARAMSRPLAAPVWATRQASGLTDSVVSDLILNLGGPQRGQYWDVKNVVVGGPTWATSVNGTALLVVSAQMPSTAASVGIAMVADEATSLPSPAFYSEGQVRVYPPDRVYVIVVGGSATTTYVAVARALEYQDGLREQVAI